MNQEFKKKIKKRLYEQLLSEFKEVPELLQKPDSEYDTMDFPPSPWRGPPGPWNPLILDFTDEENQQDLWILQRNPWLWRYRNNPELLQRILDNIRNGRPWNYGLPYR